ncbi:MAG: response regulator [Kiritimatiellia bacterium]|jgi:CheY-like chemotaxis protein|nr:response regulator [Kiritimatiellia bacterium]
MSIERRRLLVIDDDVMVHKVIEAAAQRHGIEVSIAGDGREGIAFLKENRGVDLVLVDLLMPFVSGWDVVEFLVKEGQETSPYVVVMSGAPIQEVEKKKIGSRVDGFMAKDTFSLKRFDALLSNVFPAKICAA